MTQYFLYFVPPLVKTRGEGKNVGILGRFYAIESGWISANIFRLERSS